MYMLYLMIVNRSREIVSIMGHDVKQFKSLEGFLESAPQFVLQTYILMTEGYKEEDKGEEYAASTKNSIVLCVHCTCVTSSTARIDQLNFCSNIALALQNASSLCPCPFCSRFSHWPRLATTSMCPIQTTAESLRSTQKMRASSSSRLCFFTLW